MAYRIGVFGGMASGKSTAISLLQSWGARVYSADKINAELLTRDSYIAALAEICPACVTSDGVDRAILREWMLADENNRRTLEALAHPIIREELLSLTAKGLSFVEISVYVPDFIPLDEAWVVTCPDELRIRRIMGRGFEEEQAKKMLLAQQKGGVAPPNSIPLDGSGTVENLAGILYPIWKERERAHAGEE